MTASELDRDLIAAYAVGALDGEERSRVEEALQRDPASRAELAGHLDTLATLATRDAVDHPAALWTGIQARLAAPGPTPTDAVADVGVDDPPFPEMTFTLQRRSEPEDWHHATHPPSMAPSAHVSGERPRAAGGAGRRGQVIRAVLAAAAVVALLVVGIGLVTREPETPTLAQVAAGALDDPDARQLTLVTTGGHPVARAGIWDSGVGCLVVDDLPPLAAGDAYQVWMLRDGTAPPISLGFVDPAVNDGTATFTLDPAATGLALSREPAGGSVAPTEVLAAGSIEPRDGLGD